MTWPTFKTQDEVPEAFRDQYHEVEGEWVAKEPEPTTDPKLADLEKDVATLRETLDKEREIRKNAEKEAKAEAEARKKAEQEAKAKEAGLTPEELKQLRADIEADTEAKYKEHIEQATTLQGRVTELLLDNKVKAQAIKHGVIPERVDAWWALNRGEFELNDSEEPAVKGKRTADVGRYIGTELKEKFGYLYEGTKGGGGGAGGSHIDPTGSKTDISEKELLSNPQRALHEARQGAA